MFEPLSASNLSYRIVTRPSKPLKLDVNRITGIFAGRYSSSVNCDGVIGDFRQSYITGDCYLLSSLYSLSKTEKGAEILKNNIKKEKNGSYTVTLPGALIIKKDYAKMNKKCCITGRYTITASELSKAVKNANYANGDADVVLYELAFEKYRKEVMETNKLNHQNSHYGNAGQYTGNATGSHPLNGGIGHDAIFVLTGKQSVNYEISSSSVAAIDTQHIKTVHSASTINRKSLERLLNKIEKNPGRYSGTFSIKLKENGQITGYHAVSISKIKNGRVYFVNPWNSKKEFSLSKQEFLRAAYQVNIVDMEESGLMENLSDYAYNIYDNFVSSLENLFRK